jgi:acyl-CoA synthetase (AMP-forming)/AMP-acid ligase II
MIKSGGNRTSAKEVEDVIAEMPEIIEVAVVGAPHELLGESIKAFVSLSHEASITAENVRAHCRKRLPASKIPEEIIFVGSLPHSSSGKVLKSRLKDMLESRQAHTFRGERQPSNKRRDRTFEPCPA